MNQKRILQKKTIFLISNNKMNSPKQEFIASKSKSINTLTSVLQRFIPCDQFSISGYPFSIFDQNGVIFNTPYSYSHSPKSVNRRWNHSTSTNHGWFRKREEFTHNEGVMSRKCEFLLVTVPKPSIKQMSEASDKLLQLRVTSLSSPYQVRLFTENATTKGTNK